MNNDTGEYTISFETIPNAMFSYKEKLYYSDSFSNGLFRFSPRYKTVEYVSEFNECGVFDVYLYNSVVTLGTKAFFIPYNADSIALFDIEQSLVKDIKLPIEIRNKKEKFFVSGRVGNKIYMFGYKIDDIYSFNIELQTYSKIKINKKILKLLTTSSEKGILIRDISVINDSIYFSSIYQNCIFKLDTDDDQITVIPVPIKNKGIYFMSLDSENKTICIVPTDGIRLIFYEIYTGKFVEKVVEEQKIEVAFSKPLYYNNHFYLMPCWGNQSVCINAGTYEIIDQNFTCDNLQKEDRGKGYINGIQVEHCMVYVANSPDNRRCFIYNCEQETYEIAKIIISRRIVKNMIKEFIGETKSFMLKDYLKMLI